MSVTAAPKSLECVVHLRRAHKQQRQFIGSKAKRKIIRAGRRSGKTTGVAIWAVERFLAGRRVLYATPTADQIKKFWSEVTQALAEPIQLGGYYKNETEHVIELKGTDQRIRAKTAWNADTLRGDYADDLILDEWQLMDEAAWSEVGAPMLIDNNGDAVFIYTPPSLHSAGVSKAEDPRHASKMYKRAVADSSGRWAAFTFTSYDNPYLSQDGLAEVTHDMTALAHRQEILAEDIDELPGALWTRNLIETTRVETVPVLQRIVVGVDPSGSSRTEAGIVGVGQGVDDHLYVLRDRSLLAPSPRAWAAAAVMLYDELKADRIAGERNFGGDMVEETIRTVDANVSYKDVNASRGKMVRAEPIAALFEKGMAHFVGLFEQLEEECCSYVPGAKSPNRMDAMVWAATELATGGVLGLIEYFKTGRAEAAVKELNKIEVSAMLAKVTVNDKTLRCPECKCVTVQTIAGGQKRCAECGAQWWANGGAPRVTLSALRSEYLRKGY